MALQEDVYFCFGCFDTYVIVAEKNILISSLILSRLCIYFSCVENFYAYMDMT